MANEAVVKEFKFLVCPYCGASEKDQHILRIMSDDTSTNRLFLSCDSCGIIYQVSSRIIWEAREVGKANVPTRCS